MNVADFERLAVETYARNGLDPREPADPIELARRLLKTRDPLHAAPWLTSGAGALLRRAEGPRIVLKPGLPVQTALFTVCHELAHLVFDEIGFRDARLENACDYLGACFLSPAPATKQLVRAFRDDAASIAGAVAGTQTWAAMRIGEVLGVPLVFYDARRNKRRVRGGGEQLELFRDTERLRDAVLKGRSLPGTRKVPIRDASMRVAFVKVA